MVLTADIGNTSITLGVFDGDKLKFTVRLSTETERTEDEYAGKIRTLLYPYGVNKDNIEGAIISSVVPCLNSVFKSAINIVYGVDALMVSSKMDIGIDILCDAPATVGADLICSCVATKEFYRSPALIIDIGTATKMIVTDKNGAFTGVSIIPGVMMGLHALSSGTAQLPQVSLEAPARVIGKNTVDCMKSGVVFGNASLIDGMIERINDEVGEKLPVYVTGGYSHSIIPHCKRDMIHDPALVLKGLNILYHKNR
ncbi:MAG: type III pantothenate kinase [Eubacteriales bacterium]